MELNVLLECEYTLTNANHCKMQIIIRELLIPGDFL